MSIVNLREFSEPPEEGCGVAVSFKHPLTEFDYRIALFQVEGNYYAITDKCVKCGGSLCRGTLRGLFAFCHNEECGWSIRKGFCKYDRTMIMPTYKVTVEDNGFFIKI